MNDELYKVYAIYSDGRYFEPYVTKSPENAVNKAVLLAELYPEVMICDGLDRCNLHIKNGELVFPKR